MRQQLEEALAAAAEEVETIRARVEEVLPMALDEAAPANGTSGSPTLSPTEEPTLDSDDNSEEELEPELTSAQQWSQLWKGAKAKAQAQAKTEKATLKVAGKAVDPAKDWNLETFQRVETTVQSRRKVPVTSQVQIGKPFRKGAAGPIKHPRTGLAGGVQYWARGSRVNVVMLLLKLIRHFGVEASVRDQLGRKEVRDAATYARAQLLV